MSQRPAKDKWNQTLEENPKLSEFKKSLPTQAEVNIFRPGLVQSEFKKPYQDQGYEEMEYADDPPPGISWKPPGWPTYDLPPTTTITTPGDPGTGENIIFHAFIDGKPCAGATTTIRIHATQRMTKVKIKWPSAGWSIKSIGPKSNPWSSAEVTLPESAQGILLLDVYMIAGKIRGTSDASTDILDSTNAVCPRLWISFTYGQQCTFYKPPTYFEVDHSETFYQTTVWDLKNNRVANDIPDGLGGIVSMPCLPSALNYWLGIAKREVPLHKMMGWSLDHHGGTPTYSDPTSCGTNNGELKKFYEQQLVWDYVECSDGVPGINKKTYTDLGDKGVCLNVRNIAGTTIGVMNLFTWINQVYIEDKPTHWVEDHFTCDSDEGYPKYTTDPQELFCKNTGEFFDAIDPNTDNRDISLGVDSQEFHKTWAYAAVSTWNRNLTSPKYPDVEFMIDLRNKKLFPENNAAVELAECAKIQYWDTGKISQTQDAGMPTTGSRNSGFEDIFSLCINAARNHFGYSPGGAWRMDHNAIDIQCWYGGIEAAV
jgi:hypothetical protein